MGSGTVEIITGRERHRRWSVADKLRILAECDAPGVQVSEVAARHGVYRSLIFQWRRQARDGLMVAKPMPEFVPVRVAVAARQQRASRGEATGRDQTADGRLVRGRAPSRLPRPLCRIRLGLTAASLSGRAALEHTPKGPRVSSGECRLPVHC